MSHRSPDPSPVSGLGCLELLSGGLVGHLGPEKAGEFAGDRDGHDGGALALSAEMAVAGKEADLRLPDAIGGVGSGGGAPAGVSVVPGRFGQQPAGVAVAGLGDVPAVLLIAAGVLAGADPSHDASSRG